MSPARPAGTLPLMVLLDEAVTAARRHFRELYFPVAVPLALVAGFVPLGQSLWMRGVSATGRPDPVMFLSGMAAFFATLLASVLSVLLGHAALLFGCVDALSGRPVSMSRAWRLAVTPRILGTMLLAGLITLAGFAFCILPGVYAWLILCLVVPVMAAEGRFGVDALGRSVRLMSRNPGRELAADPRLKAFVVLFVGWLLGYLIGLLVTLPAVVLQEVLMFRRVAEGARPDPAAVVATMTWIQVPANMLGVLGRVAVFLYVGMALTLLFFDLRRRREGPDLEAAVAALAGTDAP